MEIALYVPKPFEENNRGPQRALIERAPLGALVIHTEQGLVANHIPFVYREGRSNGERDVLCAHIPRANPLSGQFDAAGACLVIFNGPDGYVSPSWYATKPEHGKVVPTWNYAVVHVHGHARIVDDEQWVANQIEALTDGHERPRSEPWTVADAPAEYTRALLKTLVGLEVQIERVEGKIKASQNQPERNRQSVLEALREEQPDTDFAQLMRSVLDER